ncbi:MAG: hypothetical protein AB1757_20220 [Acidobacteriota bacterium]
MSGNQCLTKAELRNFLAGAGSPAIRETIEQHLSLCGGCRQLLVAQQELSKVPPDELRAPEWLKAQAQVLPNKKNRFAAIWSGDWRRGLAVAASLIVIMGLAWFFILRPTHQPASPQETWRQEASLLASPLLLAPVNGAVVHTTTIEFQWSEVEGADHYLFTLLNDKGDILFQSTTREGKLRLSTTEAALRDAQVYYWYVGAKSAFGMTAESPVGKFTLTIEREN